MCDDPLFPQLRRCSVSRRFSDFEFLRDQLCNGEDMKGFIVPPLPVKQTLGRVYSLRIDIVLFNLYQSVVGAGRFEPSFLEERRSGLALFLHRLCGHHSLSLCSDFHSFLSKSGKEWMAIKKCHCAQREGMRESLSDWVGSALQSMAAIVGKGDGVELGFNTLDVQVGTCS